MPSVCWGTSAAHWGLESSPRTYTTGDAASWGDAAMTVLEQAASIAAKCQSARRTGDRWQCLCPSHDDTQASLTITAKDDRVLIHCHAGCSTRIILQDLNLTERYLF